MSNRTMVHETANAPGTNVVFNLAGNVQGRRSFAMAFTTGAPCLYVMVDGVQAEWGMGTFTAGAPNTLSRTTVFGNSAGTTARLNFVGLVDVYNAVPAELGLFLGGLWAGTFGGTANALTATVPMPLRARQADTLIRGLVTTPNTATDPTLTLNGLSAGTIKSRSGGGLPPGALRAGVVELLDDGTNYRLLSPSIVGLGTSVQRSSAASVPSGTPTAITWQVEGFDDLAAWASGDAITIPAGVSRVHVTGIGGWGSSTGTRSVAITLNGASIVSDQRSANGTTDVSISAYTPVSAGDLIRLSVAQDSGVTINFSGRLQVVVVA